MGSYNMAVNKILSVLLVAGSTPAWTNPQQFFNFNQNSFATERPAPATPSTTPVPILRYVDNQNIDGSYTYGYEAADGTYKLETRYVDGRVKGKYGYIDPEGVLREASYGAEAGRGFEPEISGLELPPPVTSDTQEPAFNEIPDVLPVQQKKFSNFQPNNNNNNGRVKVANGRRALVKKVRRVKATPAPQQFIDEEATKQANLKARQQQLRTLEEHRRQLLEVQRQQQQQQSGGRQQQARAFSSFPSRQQTEQFRSAAPAVQGVQASDPFISSVDLSSGSYSYAY